MKNKKKKEQKCHICFQHFKREKLNKHMHSRSHHEAIERLKGGQQSHTCLACKVSALELEQYVTHISTTEHLTNLDFLEDNCRKNGIAVDYNDAELNAICALRDQKRLVLKRRKKREKEKIRRAKVAARSQETCHQKWQMKNREWSTGTKGPSNPGVRMQGGVIFPSWQVDGSQESPSRTKQQTETGKSMQQRNQKRLLHADPLGLTHISLKPKENTSACGRPSAFSEGTESNCRRQPAFPDKPSASGLEQSHVTRLSTMVRSIHKSLAVKALSVGSSAGLEPKPTPANANRLEKRQHVHHKETLCKKTLPGLSEVLHLSEKGPRLSPGWQAAGGAFLKKSHKGEEQIGKPKRRSSPQIKPSSAVKRPAIPDTDMLTKKEKGDQQDQGPSQKKHAIPALMTRPLSKAEVRKPNLTLARGVHASRRPSRVLEQSKLLKPALQKLISCKSSQWRVNWRKICQEATKTKPQRERGMPRFGVDFISPLTPDPKDLAAKAAEDFTLDEGFQWKSISSDTAETALKIPMGEDNCRSRSANAPLHSAGPGTKKCGGASSRSYALQPKGSAPERKEERKHGHVSSARGKEVDTSLRVRENNAEHAHTAEPEKTLHEAFETQHGVMTQVSSVCVKTKRLDEYSVQQFQTNDDYERFEAKPVRQIIKKKQSTPLITKEPTKEQVSELLAMSLREEELSSSLTNTDGHLLQARAALHAAYAEAQRLQVVRQQVITEMASLRAKRIEILRRMQNSNLCKPSSGYSPNPANETHQRAPDTSADQQPSLLNHSLEILERAWPVNPTPGLCPLRSSVSAFSGLSAEPQRVASASAQKPVTGKTAPVALNKASRALIQGHTLIQESQW